MSRGGWSQGPFDFGKAPQFPKIPAGVVKGVLALLVAVILFWTGYYQVEPDEVGVVTRFGRHVRTTDPGPHLKIPFGIERVQKVPVLRTLKMEFGFKTSQPGQRSQYTSTDETKRQALMLTGDLNVAVVEWIVQYNVSDPVAYLFNIRDVDATFSYMSEAALRQVVGDHSVDEVLTIGREAIAMQAKEELQRLCKAYGIGITVQQLILQDVNPPDSVRPAFNEVNQAIQEKERAINDAWADYNKEVPKAKGEAEQAVRAAEGYALERVNNAEGDAKRFEALYEEYRKAPAVTRKRIYLETMGQLMPRLGRRIVVDSQVRGVLPLFSLGGEAKEVKP